jgi:isopentenyl diphosphate isomerase/L-lactate dehydrogenase-like FMN-dependent dehydrogenase
VEWIKKRWGGKLILKGIRTWKTRDWRSTRAPMR